MAASSQSLRQDTPLAPERLANSRSDNPYPRRTAQILVHDEPRRAQRRGFIRPDAGHLIALVAQDASELCHTDIASSGSELDEWTVAPQRNPSALEGLTQEERTRCRRHPCEGDEIVAGKTAAAFRGSASGEIAARSI